MAARTSTVRESDPFYAVLALTATLVTALRLVARSVAPFPYAPRLEDLALSFLL
jgi:hypothetical protein